MSVVVSTDPLRETRLGVPAAGFPVSENVLKIHAFCLGTAILHELHLRVADSAIREYADHVSAPYVGSHRPAITGGKPGLRRAAGFLLAYTIHPSLHALATAA
jgi:hypothetical protein